MDGSQVGALCRTGRELQGGPTSAPVAPGAAGQALAPPGRQGPEAAPTGQRARTVALAGANRAVAGAGPCATGRRERRGPSRLGAVNPADSQGLALGWTARLSAGCPPEGRRERFASRSPCGATPPKTGEPGKRSPRGAIRGGFAVDGSTGVRSKVRQVRTRLTRPLVRSRSHHVDAAFGARRCPHVHVWVGSPDVRAPGSSCR